VILLWQKSRSFGKKQKSQH
jgi:hypothetical protein